MRRQCRKVIGIVIHVVAVARLGGSAVAAPVMGHDAIAGLRKNSICVSQSSADSGQPWLNTMGCPLPQSPSPPRGDCHDPTPSFRDLYEPLLNELRRSRHGIGLDL